MSSPELAIRRLDGKGEVDHLQSVLVGGRMVGDALDIRLAHANDLIDSAYSGYIRRSSESPPNTVRAVLQPEDMTILLAGLEPLAEEIVQVVDEDGRPNGGLGDYLATHANIEADAEKRLWTKNQYALSDLRKWMPEVAAFLRQAIHDGADVEILGF